jgi:hypothetical protein
MKRASVTALTAVAAFLTMTGTLGAEELFTGSLYRMGTDRAELLFLQYNEVENDGVTFRITHRYALPDGAPYAVEEVVRENGEFKAYRVEFYLLGTSGSIRRDGEVIFFTYSDGDGWKSIVYRYQKDILCGPSILKVEDEGAWRSVNVDAYYTYERIGALAHGQ